VDFNRALIQEDVAFVIVFDQEEGADLVVQLLDDEQTRYHS
jgi:hypothetical protein